jgi:hypothetical protein
VATVVGALLGLALGGWLEAGPIAVIAGFLGTLAAGIVRNTLLVKAWGAIVEDVGTPFTIVIYAALASFAGSLTADLIMALYRSDAGSRDRRPCGSLVSGSTGSVDDGLSDEPRPAANR